MILDLHHIQLAMPEGGEAKAIAFYRDVLGCTLVDKPEILQGRGGVWFACGAARLHLGVERPFAPARKAHPGFRVASLAMAEARLAAKGVPIRRDVDLPDIRRVYIDDPFGNRIEILEAI